MKRKRRLNKVRIFFAIVVAGILSFSAVTYNILYAAKKDEVQEIDYIELPQEQMSLDSYVIYGTQLLLNYLEKQENLMQVVNDEVAIEQEIENYILKNKVVDNESYIFSLDNFNSQGIDFQNVAVGEYYLLLNSAETEYTVTAKQMQSLQFYTVRVNGIAKKVVMEATNDSIYFSVTEVAGTDFLDADIILDPGHGNIEGSEQAGACTIYADLSFWSGDCEREIMLDISEYIKKRLEAHGLVVDLTRESDDADYEPTGDFTNSQYEREDFENSKADEVSKTTTIFNSNAKLSLSMHFNNIEDSSYDDLDLYQSIFIPTDTDTNFFSDSLLSYLTTAHNGDTYLLNRDYCLAYTYSEEEPDCEWGTTDYYYMIREYGGAFTGANYYDNNLIYGEQLVTPESLLIELFNGANASEVLKYEKEIRNPSTDSNLEAIVQAITDYYGIIYDNLQ